MSLYGGLAENIRRNERVDRGSISVTGSATVTVPAPMRKITSFFLTIDDAGAILSGIVGASTAVVTGSLNAAGTILTIHCNSFTSSSNPTLIASTNATTVRYQLWGNLGGSSQSF